MTIPKEPFNSGDARADIRNWYARKEADDYVRNTRSSASFFVRMLFLVLFVTLIGLGGWLLQWSCGGVNNGM